MQEHERANCPLVGFYEYAGWAATYPLAAASYADLANKAEQQQPDAEKDWIANWPTAALAMGKPGIIAAHHAVSDACADETRLSGLRTELNALKGNQAEHEKKAIRAIATETKMYLKRTRIECEPLEVVGGLLTLLVGVALQHGVSREACIRIVGDAYNINKQVRDRALTAPNN